MKKISMAEKIAIVITAAFVLVMVGIFIGRATVTSSVVVEAAQPEESAYIYDLTQSTAKEEKEVADADLDNAASEVHAASSSDEVSDVENKTVWSIESGTLLDLNLASQEELENLPLIGPVLAEEIISYRDSIGGFSNVAEIINVQGIGEKTYEKISPYLRIGE